MHENRDSSLKSRDLVFSTYDLGSFCAMRPMTFENKRKKKIYLEMNTAKREIFSNQP